MFGKGASFYTSATTAGIAAVAIASWLGLGASAFADGSPEDAVLAAVNTLRSEEGLAPLTLQQNLNTAAKNHSNYMSTDIANVDHVETQTSSPFYTGQSPADRVASAGFGSFTALYENLEIGTPFLQGVSQLFASPYHRYAFLDPNTSKLGVGMATFPGSDQYAPAPLLTMEFASTEIAGSSPVVSPADGQSRVPVAWTDYESPDPLRFYQLPQQNPTVGYPIVVYLSPPLNGSTLLHYHIQSMTLQDANGKLVPSYLNTADRGDSETALGPVLLPKTPLEYGAAYTASINGTYQVQTEYGDQVELALRKTWSFTTQSKPMESNGVNLVVNDRFVMPEQSKMIDGHTWIPAKNLADLLGLQFLADDPNQTAYLFHGNRLLSLKQGQSTFTLNRDTEPVGIDVQIQNDQYWVPLRSVVQLFGDRIIWEDSTQTIFISTS